MSSSKQSQVATQKSSKKTTTKHPCRKDRFRAAVIQIGETPMLKLDNGGEYYFAYRSVKKRPGEQRQILVVGDIVDCRLTKTIPAKAVSIKIVSKLPQPKAEKDVIQNVYQHDPYAVPDLMSELGGKGGVDSVVDSYLDSLLSPPKATSTQKQNKLMSIGDDFPTDVIFLGKTQPFSVDEEELEQHSLIPEAPSCMHFDYEINPFVPRVRSTSCPPIRC